MDIVNNSSNADSANGLVSVDVLAGLLNLTHRRIQQLASDGVIPMRNARGEYHLAGSIRGYVNFLQKDGVVDENLIAEKLAEEIENLKLKNKKLKLSNDREEGFLVDRNASMREMALIAKTGLQILETLPDILERDCGLDADLIGIVEAKIDALREQWAGLVESEE